MGQERSIERASLVRNYVSKHRAGCELLRTGSRGVGYGTAGAIRTQRSPSPGALMGVGDQELGMGQLSSDIGQGGDKLVT